MTASSFTGLAVRHYTVGEQVGRGGYSAIYRALDQKTGKPVAIKVILPEHETDYEVTQRLEREADIIRDLDHPHIIHFRDYWRDKYGTWLVMDWLGGGDVRQKLEKEGAFSLQQCADILEQICPALHVLHQADIIHRDLKPDNIMLDDTGKAYLTDFGIAKRLDFSPLTSFGIVMGSPLYLTPEQIMGEPISPQTDICSLGITLYEMLAGAHPYARIKNHVRVMLMLAQETLPPINKRHPHIPEAASLVIARATAQEPEDRYETTLQLADDFRKAITDGT